MMNGHKAVVLFYQYFTTCHIPDFVSEHAEFYVDHLEQFQKDLCEELGAKGRILLAIEGINGTLSGKSEDVIEEYISRMKSFHILRDCGTPNGSPASVTELADERNLLFRDVDWKKSKVEEDAIEPFPDLKISVVKEIVSTGGIVQVDEIPHRTGKHLSPKEFHHAMIESDKPVVLIDVRNTFEYDIGHFVNPKTGEAAMNPEMVTFSSFDSKFCAENAEFLRDKKVLMYCTGGIRCEKASVMLRNRGVDDVSQLSGGIHRYLEEFGGTGHYRGLNFVFDQRVAMKPEEDKPWEVVGRCLECAEKFDELSGSRRCTVCQDLVLVCPRCESTLREYHCHRHSTWKDCYFTFLDVFDETELLGQIKDLEILRHVLIPASAHKNQRRTLSRQIEKVQEQLGRLSQGTAVVDRNAPRRCRTCMKSRTLCDGKCWGFWKTATESSLAPREEGGEGASPAAIQDTISPIAIGDIVEPGNDWNSIRLGDTMDKDGNVLRGEVTSVKSWAGSLERDCVSVLWNDGVVRGRNQAKLQSQIYRWGVLAVDGRTRIYDVRRVGSSDCA